MRYCGICGEPKRTPKGKHTHVRQGAFGLSAKMRLALPRQCPVDVVIEGSDTHPAVLRSSRLAKVIRRREAAVVEATG